MTFGHLAFGYIKKGVVGMICCSSDKGFMEDQIIASHTCFVGHVGVNC